MAAIERIVKHAVTDPGPEFIAPPAAPQLSTAAAPMTPRRTGVDFCPFVLRA